MTEPETTTWAADPDLTFGTFLVDAYPRFLRLARLLTADRGRAEDLTQETFWRVHRAWGDLREPAAATAFTRTVMVRLATRWRMRRWHGEQPSTSEQLEAVGGAGQAATALRQGVDPDVVRALDRALASLPTHQRAVLVLRYYEERSEAEIAALLGCSPGTVKSRASRGLAALRAGGLAAELDPDVDHPTDPEPQPGGRRG